MLHQSKLKLAWWCSTLVVTASAWIPPLGQQRTPLKVPVTVSKQHNSFDPLDLAKSYEPFKSAIKPHAAVLISGVALAGTPSVASAVTAIAPSAVPAAVAAYAHYASLLVMAVCAATQRATIKPNMTEEEESVLTKLNLTYLVGVGGIVLGGYLRWTQYEKGWGFYQNEPLFWLKMLSVGILAASSTFNSTKLMQRALARRNGEFEPMSPALAKRMGKIYNAELVALAIIPLISSLMARGVVYSTDIPWKGEAALVAFVSAGLLVKYMRDSLTFERKNAMMDDY